MEATTKSEPKQLMIAREELARGVHEVNGPGSNPRIDEYHSATNAGTPPRDGDATAWCSSFMCFCFESAGIRSPRRKAARSWLEWGRETSHPKPGDVAVLWRVSPNSGSGHVAMFVGFDDIGRPLLLGGNQGNAVSIKAYPPSRVLSYRRASQIV